MSILAPSIPGFWDILARAWAATTGITGKLSDLKRAEITAQAQADVRQAGGTLEDQQKVKDEIDSLANEHNARAGGFLKTLAGKAVFLVIIGVITFAIALRLKLPN